jgi:alcohol dehydrogenase class IV
MHGRHGVFQRATGDRPFLYLPYVIQRNRPKAEKRYASIARYVGISGTSPFALTDELVQKIRDLNKKFSIPSTLKEFGIKEDEFKEKVGKIAENAVGDPCTGANPRPVAPQQMKELLECIYYGKDVNIA